MPNVMRTTPNFPNSARVMLVGVLLVLMAGCSAISFKDMAEIQCEDLVPEVIDLSKRNRNPLAQDILKIYNVSETSRTSKRLACEGTARWSRDDDMRVTFYIEEDQDGDRFIGYRGQP